MASSDRGGGRSETVSHLLNVAEEYTSRSTHKGAELLARAPCALTSVVEDDTLIIAHLDVGRRFHEDELLVKDAVNDLQTRVRLLLGRAVLQDNNKHLS